VLDVAAIDAVAWIEAALLEELGAEAAAPASVGFASAPRAVAKPQDVETRASPQSAVT